MIEQQKTKHLLAITFVVIFLMSNWFDAKIITLNGYLFDAGTLIFPFTFMINSILSETFGYKYAKRAVALGIIFNLVFLLFGMLIDLIPTPVTIQNVDFNTIMAINLNIVIASIFSYGCAELCNSKLTSVFKTHYSQTNIALRHSLALSAATFVDSVIFSIIAFFGILNIQQLSNVIASTWLIKIAMQLLLVPFSSQISKKLIENDKSYNY